MPTIGGPAMAGSAATVTTPSDAQQQQPMAPTVPFVRASWQHNEPADLDRTLTALVASSALIGPVDVPAYGYLRSILLQVDAAGGTGVAAVAQADAPWSVISELVLHDVNGAPIVGPFTGYDLYLAHKYGGYAFRDDPITSPSFQTVQTNGNYSFILRIPVEVSDRDALGALPNMNASSTYKLRITAADATSVYSTPPTTAPTVRFRAWAECWAPPSATNDLGQAQAVQPPALGTTQMWTKFQDDVANGFNNIRFQRVGNYIRNLIMVNRNSSNARTNTGLPTDLQVFVDGRLLVNEALTIRRHLMSERYAATGTVEAGVIVYDFCHDFDGKVGGEMRDNWLQTNTSTRLELQATWSAGPGSLQILTNDIAPVGDVFLP
jgi:hypothetical protein